MNRVLREILAIRATLEVGHRCPESFRQSDIDDSSWTDHYRHMAYFRPPFFYVNVLFCIWLSEFEILDGMRLKNFQVQKKETWSNQYRLQMPVQSHSQIQLVHSIKCTRISFLFESCWIHVTFKVIKLFMIWSHIIWLILYGPYNIGYVI